MAVLIAFLKRQTTATSARTTFTPTIIHQHGTKSESSPLTDGRQRADEIHTTAPGT